MTKFFYVVGCVSKQTADSKKKIVLAVFVGK